MRWISMVLGAALLVAVAAQPAGAVRLDLPIIDVQGSPVMDITIVSNWGGGKVTQMTTDGWGRVRGEVPEGWHFCSVWWEGTHIESGVCNLTDDLSLLFKSRLHPPEADPRYVSYGNGHHGYAPVRPRIVLAGISEEEEAARRGVEFKFRSFPEETFRNPRAKREILARRELLIRWGVIGVLFADTFGLTGENRGGGGGDGDGE